MSQELNVESKATGLRINASKKKYIQSEKGAGPQIYLEGQFVKEVKNLRCRDQTVNMRYDMSNELKQRCRGGWATFHSVQDLVRKAEPTDRAHLFSAEVLPCMLHVSET